MPREQTRRTPGMNLAAPGGQSAQLGVFASPTARAGTAAMSPEVEGLLKGLSSLSAAVQVTDGERKAAEAKEAAAGRDSARAGGSREAAAARSRTFLEGFIEGSGEAAAIADAQELAAEYETNAPKDSPDISEFVGTFYQKKMKGADDPVFRRGYDRIFGSEAMKLRSKHGEGLAVGLVDRKMTEAQTRIDYAARTLVGQGKPLGDEFLAAVNTIAGEVSLSGVEKDEAIMRTLEQYAAKGVPSVFEITRAPRKDPKTGAHIPPMYDNPRWRERIERGVREAERIALAKETAERKAAEEDRKNRQEEVIGRILQLGLSGQGEKAREIASQALQNRNLFTSGTDIANALRVVDDSLEKAESPAQQAAENTHLISIYEGKLTRQSQIAGLTDVGVMGKRRLITSLSAYLSQQRTEAAASRAASAQERAAGNEWTRNPQFRASVDLLKDQLRPNKSPFSDFTPTDEADRAAQAMAEREYINWMASNPTASDTDVNAKSVEIVQRYKAARGDPNDATSAQARLDRLGIPYRNTRELLAAHDRGLVDPQTFQLFLSVLGPMDKRTTK
jgi:hypothetical protein